jgi:hypothetical protein
MRLGAAHRLPDGARQVALEAAQGLAGALALGVCLRATKTCAGSCMRSWVVGPAPLVAALPSLDGASGPRPDQRWRETEATKAANLSGAFARIGTLAY